MTIKSSIIHYLESNPGPQYGGRISRAVAEIHECKESNVERRQRELEDEGKILSEYVSNPNGRGNKVVSYRLKPVNQSLDSLQTYRPGYLQEKAIKDSQKQLL